MCVYYEMYCMWAVQVVWYVVVLLSKLLLAESLSVQVTCMRLAWTKVGSYYSVNLPLKDGIDDLNECERARVL